MTTPVQITDLPVATQVDDADLLIVRKGLSDFQAEASLVRVVNLAGLISLSNPQNTDLMLIQRGSTRYSLAFSKVGFVQGVKTWFYQDAPPTGWELVPSISGDALLAVKGGINDYNKTGGTESGTWQQTAIALTIDQMPSHSHNVKSRPAKETTGNLVKGYNTGTTSQRWATELEGGGQPHDHGKNWRPLANIGIICQKQA